MHRNGDWWKISQKVDIRNVCPLDNKYIYMLYKVVHTYEKSMLMHICTPVYASIFTYCMWPQFQFGGKLVTFENAKTRQQPGIEQQQHHHHVYVSQVVTEEEFLARSIQLQEAVQSEGFVSYCQKKIDMAQADFEKNVWAFLKVTG